MIYIHIVLFKMYKYESLFYEDELTCNNEFRLFHAYLIKREIVINLDLLSMPNISKKLNIDGRWAYFLRISSKNGHISIK